MPLKSIYLLPHGGIIVPGMEPNRDDDDDDRRKAADVLLNRMEEVGQEIEDDDIDIIFITSPHGYIHPNSVLVAFNSIFEAWQFYHKDGRAEQLLFPGHSQLSQIFYELLLQKNIPVEPLIFADTSFPLKVAWGEAIPLQFLSNMEDGPQVVYFSLPMKAEGEKGARVLKSVADTIYELCDAPLMDVFNVSVVVSGDLSHKHDDGHEYGFHDNAEVFDDLAVQWTKTPTRETYLELLKLHQTAESCGIFGMGVIQHLLEVLNWDHQGTIYELPTYFGMMISSWKPEKK